VFGQALELDWVRRSVWDIGDDDYVRMVELKTGWYSFIAPVLIGGIAARLPEERSQQLADFARSLGIAFQIQDDLLNLDGDEVAYGKESCGDLWEGKRTLVLLHLMRSATEAERAEIHRILALPRPRQPHEADGAGRLSALLEELSGDGHLSAEGRTRLQDALAPAAPVCKQTDDVLHLRALIDRYGSVEYARGVAGRWARDAAERLDACRAWMLPSVHLDFLQELVEYVHARER
jgi:geranylgeranyl diphosphate synthase type II